MMERIVTFDRSFDESVLSKVFTRQEHSDFEFPMIDINEIVDKIKGGAVCIAADSASDVLSRISKDIGKDVRQYVLLSDKKSASRVNAGKYVRITKHHQHGMVIIHVNGKDYKTWLFPSKDSSRAYAVQGDTLYRSFCNLFWSQDILCEFRGNNIERSANSPLSQDLKLNDSCSLPDNLSEVFSRYYDSSFYSSDPSSDFLSQSDLGNYAKLFLSFSQDSARICSKASCESYLFEKRPYGNFSLITDGSTGYLLPEHIRKDGINWSIALNKNGCQAFMEAFDISWMYNESIPIKVAVDSDVCYLDNVSKIFSIQKTSEIEESYRCSNIEQFLDDASVESSFYSGFDSSRPLALSVKFIVKSLPPKCPNSAKKDPLYESWASVLKSWKESLDALQVKCDNYFKGALPAGDAKTANESILEKEHNDIIKEIRTLLSIDISIESEKQRTRHVESYQTLCSKVELFTIKCLEIQKKREFETDKSQAIQKLESEISLAKEKIKEKEDEFSSCEKSFDKFNDKKKKQSKKKFNS